jgi:hypothetical protein
MKTEQIAPSFWQVTLNHEQTRLVFWSQTSRQAAIQKAHDYVLTNPSRKTQCVQPR